MRFQLSQLNYIGSSCNLNIQIDVARFYLSLLRQQAPCQGPNGSLCPAWWVGQGSPAPDAANHGWHGASGLLPLYSPRFIRHYCNLIGPESVARASLFSCGLGLWCCVGITQVSHLGRTIKLKGKLNESSYQKWMHRNHHFSPRISSYLFPMQVPPPPWRSDVQLKVHWALLNPIGPDPEISRVLSSAGPLRGLFSSFSSRLLGKCGYG